MAVQVTPITPSLPATTGISDPATRQFANAVADALRAMQGAGGAVATLAKAAQALSAGSGQASVGASPVIAQWLASSSAYQRLNGEIQRVEAGAQQGLTDETLARAQAITDAQTALQTQINAINGELAAIAQTPEYDAAEPYAAGDLVTYNGGLYRALQATTGNQPNDTAYWEKVGDYASLGEAVAAHALQLADHETRVTQTESGLTAEAGARTLLAAQVSSNTAAIQSEATTRATQDAALSQQITTVVAQYQAADAATNAKLNVPAYDSATLYSPGDPVIYSGAIYQALLLTKGVAPTDTTQWALLRPLSASPDLLYNGVLSASVSIEPHKTLMQEVFTSSFGTWMLGDINLSGGAKVTALDALDLLKHFNGQVVRPYVDEFFLPTILANPSKYAIYFETGATTLSAERAARQAAIQTEATARADADGALAESISVVSAAAGENAANIINEATARATDDLSIVRAIDTLWGVAGASKTLSESGKNLIANWQTATAEEWQTLQAEVLDAGGNTLYAAVAAESTARASFEGKVLASYMLRAAVDTGTGKPYVAGIALGVEGQGESVTSEFIVQADKFALVMPGYGNYVPFAIGDLGMSFSGQTNWSGVTGAGKPEDGATVGATIGTNLSGQITEANVSTFIANAAIGNAQIGNVIQSSNYVAGKSGWHINKSGYAEFQDALFRGKVLGSIIEGSTIVASNLTRYTDAGDPFFTYYASTLKSADTTVFVKTEGGNVDEINSLTGVLEWYPFDAGPSGIAKIDHFKSSAIALQVSGYVMTDAKLGRYDDEWGAYVYLTDEAGNILEQVFGHWYENGGLGTYTENGLLVTPVYYSYTYNASSDGYVPVYVTEVRGAALSGTLSKTWSAATWGGQRLRLRWKIVTNRGGYSGTFDASSYLRLSAKNHELT